MHYRTTDWLSDGEERLFLQERVSELIRVWQANGADGYQNVVQVHRDAALARRGWFADIVMETADGRMVYIESKAGLPPETLISAITNKYRDVAQNSPEPIHLRLIASTGGDQKAVAGVDELRRLLGPNVNLEVWDGSNIASQLLHQYQIDLTSDIDPKSPASEQDLRQARKKWAFCGHPPEDSLADTLLWHFSPWKLRSLTSKTGRTPEDFIRPGVYPNVATVIADLCSFSSFVRDTPNEEIVRRSLLTFYSAARHAVHDAGGFLYQFAGDQVIGLFGLPDSSHGTETGAFACAKALADIGQAVTDRWQRAIDRVQGSGGVHIGITVGDITLLPLRPRDQAHFGLIGDSINMSARLMSEAKTGEIIVSNSFYRGLADSDRSGFEEMEPIEAKNVGAIRNWRHSTRVAEAIPA